VLAGAAGPLGGLFPAEGRPGLGLLLEEAGLEGVEAVGPAVFAGPVFQAIELLAQVVGGGLEGAAGAEFEESQEGAEGTGRLARAAGEG
jgi:hypothetical protein